MSGSLSSAPAPRHKTPEPSPFVGRKVELGLLSRRMNECRLVTLVGPSGSGKTRLARRFAAKHATGFTQTGGVWFVELRGAPDVESARLRIAAALDIASEGRFTGPVGKTAVLRAADALGRALLVLDNAEHLLPGLGDEIIDLLDAASRLHVLVTSRNELGLLGEEILDLGPLDDGGGDDALDLFLARLTARNVGFRASVEDRAAIKEVIRRVGGLPLTVELCAASLGAPEALAYAGVSFPVLHDPGAAALWAFSRLPPLLRDVLAQCSVFRGSFDLRAAAKVVDLPRRHGEAAVVVALSDLVGRFLVQEDTMRGRFALCESIRVLAESAREARARRAEAQLRHAELFADVATSAETSMEALALVRDDLDAALGYAHAAERADLVIRLAIGIDRVSRGSGLTARQLAVLDAGLERSPGDARLVGRALGVRAAALRGVGRMEEAAKDARVALSLSREAGDDRHAVEMLLAVGTAEFQLGELGSALARFDVAAFEARALELFDLESTALQQVGSVRASMGDAAAARQYYQSALGLAEHHGDELGEMRACAGLGSFFLEHEEHEQSEDFYERALTIADRAGAKRTYRIVLGYLGILYLHRGDLHDAESLLARAAQLSRDVGDVRVEGIFEGMRGAVLAELDRTSESARAFALADRLLDPSPFFREVVRIARGQLDLAQARLAKRQGLLADEQAHLRAARFRLAAARAPGRGDEAPIVTRSDDARMAVARLVRALGRYPNA
ncbi:MAG: AAA family ATPase [Myxococcales bacterium]|nr:AAA family ATPase [Myxococcales bacterium]